MARELLDRTKAHALAHEPNDALALSIGQFVHSIGDEGLPDAGRF